jgi:hypothetical protein
MVILILNAPCNSVFYGYIDAYLFIFAFLMNLMFRGKNESNQ